jgi:ketosteroid isomerase-like protein
MPAEENKAIVRRWFEAHTSLEGAEKAADELLAPDFVGHYPPSPTSTAPRATSSGSRGPSRPIPTCDSSSRT